MMPLARRRVPCEQASYLMWKGGEAWQELAQYRVDELS